MNAILTEIGKNAIIVALEAFPGKVWATRIAQRERAKLDAKLERHKSELQQARLTRFLLVRLWRIHCPMRLRYPK